MEEDTVGVDILGEDTAGVEKNQQFIEDQNN